MICSASRYLIVAWIIGVVAASATGSEPLAWTAATVAVAITYGLGRWGPSRFRPAGCAVPASAGVTTESGRHRDPVVAEHVLTPQVAEESRVGQ